MAQELIISISGMRGIIGENLTPEIACEYGAAFGTFLREQQPAGSRRPAVAMGRDSRPSGAMLFGAMAAGLCSAGIDVIDLGICSTPGVGVMLRHLGCVGGVVITASHNPVEYNGIKLLMDNGVAPPPPVAEEIRRRYFEKQFARVASIQCGQIRADGRVHEIHVDKVLALVDAASIARRKFRVVLDSVNGAGGAGALRLLEALGCSIIPMNIEPTGLFAHKPEPIEENLASLCERMKSNGAQIGFAQDPDADRVAIVDENGRYIGEEFSLALSAKLCFARHPGGVAAANLSTSRMIEDIAAQYGGRVVRTPVGEAHVAQAMIENACIIGGEGNGGVIDLRVGPIRDSLVGMAFVLQLMADTDRPVGRLADELGGYTMVKAKYPADKTQARRIIDAARRAWPQAKTNDSDGCRLDLPEGWIHIRTSNTEPIMRVIFETKDPAAGEQIRERLETICREVLANG